MKIKTKSLKRAHGFGRGVSGNPRGRPKVRSKSSANDNFLEEKIVITTSSGQRRSITKRRALKEVLFRQGMNGDANASKQLLGREVRAKKSEIDAALSKYKEEQYRESKKNAKYVLDKIEDMARKREMMREQEQNDNASKPIKPWDNRA